jgi:arylsulfatase A-like enzyme
MVRAGQWKLVRRNLTTGNRPAAKGPKTTTELFNIAADPREEHDAAEEHPDVVSQLSQIMREQHTPSKAFPFPALDP